MLAHPAGASPNPSPCPSPNPNPNPKQVLCSPILQELLDLRRPDLSADDLRSNWFSQESAAQVYDDYLTLDADQNGMLSASELARWRDGGLTSHFVARLFQEVNTYPNREDGMQNEMDYKLYLDFVLANMYKSAHEALTLTLTLI